MSDDPQILLRKVVQLEHLAYSAVLRAFKAQGDNNWHKQQVLESLRHYLFVSPERHQAEMLRLETDPLLNRVSSFLQKETVDRAALSNAAVTEGVNTNGDEAPPSTLSALVESDTDSASDYSESKTPKKNKTKKTSTPKKQKTTGNKRGRKPKAKPEETIEEQPVAKRPRGRPKGSGKGSTRRKNKHAFSQHNEQLKSEASSSSSVPSFPTFDLVIDPNMSVEEIETVVEKIEREITDLENQLTQKNLETHHREKIMEEVKLRREGLVQLVQQLEKALEEDEDEQVPDAPQAPSEATPNEPQEVQQPPESTPVNS